MGISRALANQRPRKELFYKVKFSGTALISQMPSAGLQYVAAKCKRATFMAKMNTANFTLILVFLGSPFVICDLQTGPPLNFEALKFHCAAQWQLSTGGRHGLIITYRISIEKQ